MGSTSKGFSFPAYSDPPDIPADIQLLAQNIDTYLTANPGPQGTTGAQGITGSQGTNGTQGAVGTQGTTGAQGTTGTQGTTGAQGIAGVQGSLGLQGSQGAQGNPGTGVNILGTYANLSDLQTAHPTGTLGDSYTISGNLYVWTGAAWTNVGPIQGSQGTVGTQGIQGSQGSVGTQGSLGTQGTAGLEGNFGGAAFDYYYSNNTANSDPTSGKFKFNNTTLSAATKIYISKIDHNSTSVYGFLQTIDDSSSAIKGHFSVMDEANETIYSMFAITGLHVEYANYIEVPISYLSGTTSLTNNEDMIITFARTGDKGDTGA